MNDVYRTIALVAVILVEVTELLDNDRKWASLERKER